MADYIRWLRGRVGSVFIQLNFTAACVCAGEQVLLQHRGDFNACPGGAIELGESAAEAAIREETGLDVEIVDLLGVYTKYEQRYRNGDVTQPITVFFRCRPTGSPAAPPSSADPPHRHPRRPGAYGSGRSSMPSAQGCR